MEFRKSLVKELLDSEEGRVLIAGLKEMYDSSRGSNLNFENEKFMYFMLGKRRAIVELENILDADLKKPSKKKAEKNGSSSFNII
jgi:hypothetical protein